MDRTMKDLTPIQAFRLFAEIGAQGSAQSTPVFHRVAHDLDIEVPWIPETGDEHPGMPLYQPNRQDPTKFMGTVVVLFLRDWADKIEEGIPK